MNTKRIIDVLTTEHTLKELITEADRRFPNWRGEEKEAWVSEFAYKWLERFDNAIPVVGGMVDVPECDQLEEATVKQLVKFVFDGMDKVAAAPEKPKRTTKKAVNVK